MNSIDTQTEIRWYMRPYLLDFLIEAHAAFELLPETLFLTVNLLDRYCSKRVVYKKHYQLVGCCALMIAAKFSDIKSRAPFIWELRSMCCSLYDDDMFRQMEWHVLATLNWAIGHPTVDNFLLLMLPEGIDPKLQHLNLFICENALFHRDFVSIPPSMIVRSAWALSRSILGYPAANQSHWIGQYNSSLMWNLFDKLRCPSPVLSRKYSSSQLSSVTFLVEATFKRQAELAQQAAAPSTAPDQPPNVNSQHGMQNTQTLPNTPHRGQPAARDTYGYMTPPITPDTAIYPMNTGGRRPQATSSSLTPPSSVEQVKGSSQMFGYSEHQNAGPA